MFSTNKRFVREGGEWMANNLPKDSSIYSNSRIAIFYSGGLGQGKLGGRI